MPLSNYGIAKPYQIEQPQSQAQQIDTMFDQLYRRIAALEAQIAATPTGGGSDHDILSATHTDTTAAAEVDGDLIVGQAGKWKRKAKGVDAQHLVMTAGAPEWSNDGSGLTNLDATDLVGVVPTAAVLHNLLSAHHPDTVVASPVAGDIVVGIAAAALEQKRFWMAGGHFGGLATTLDQGTVKYWGDGAAMRQLSTTGSAKWKRLAKGTTGQSLVTTALGVEWGAGTSGTSGTNDPLAAHVQQSGDVALVNNSTTAISFGGTTYDNGGFFSAGTPTRLTVPAGQPGLYMLHGQVAVGNPVTNGFLVPKLFKNGVEIAQQEIAGVNTALTSSGAKQVSVVANLIVGDYLELKVYAYDSSGVGPTVKGGASLTFLQITKVQGAGATGATGPAGPATTDASLLTTGTLPDGRFPAILPARDGSLLTALNATQLTTGTIPDGRFPVPVDIAYVAGNFTGRNAMTWTVAAGDVETLSYIRLGNLVMVSFAINTSTVAGVLDNTLYIQLPFTAARTGQNLCRKYEIPAAVPGAPILGSVVAGTSQLALLNLDFSNWLASVDQTYVFGFVPFFI